MITMSVPTFQRSENKLQALKDTMSMTAYTIHMCENEKIFPKKCRWTLCTRIIDTCLDCIVKIRQANKVKVETADQSVYRLALQNEVLQNFEALWALMTVAYEAYSIPSEKMAQWSALMLIAEEKVTGWKRYDVDNLKKLQA